MEMVLDVYKRLFDPRNPVICMDESQNNWLQTHIFQGLYMKYFHQRRHCGRFEFVYTPKHGNWLNMAEIELDVLTGEPLKRRMDNIEAIRKEVFAGKSSEKTKIQRLIGNSIEDARIKLSRLYPILED